MTKILYVIWITLRSIQATILSAVPAKKRGNRFLFMPHRVKLAGTATILLLLTALAYGEDNTTQLGKIHFPISANKKAQSYFKEGVLYLHSFDYEKARASFQKAQASAPTAVMPIWGEAMTYNHPLWQEQDLLAAQTILNKLGASDAKRMQKAKTEKEKGLIHAVDILYGEGDKEVRDCLYLDAMRKLYQQYPYDDEIASFYALALLGVTEGQRDFTVYMQAAGIVEEILSRNPEHPGALHYAIHSYDDPTHAPLGLRAAREYAKIAPSASHALHMPSHIFLALGMWDDVIASNHAAWNAGMKDYHQTHIYMVHDLHALDWLSYGYLQKHEYEKAYALVKIMENIAISTNTSMAKWYYGLMRDAFINESHDWQVDLKSLDMQDIELSSRASDIFTNVMIMLNKDENNPQIEAAIAELDKLCASIPDDVPKLESNVDFYTSINSGGIKAAKIMLLELRAQVKLHQGDSDNAITLLKQAAALEDKANFGYGPPVPVIPAHEMLASVLLQDKQYVAAYAEYIKALKRAPNRIDAVNGLKTATENIKQQHLEIPGNIRPYYHKLMTTNLMKGM